MKWSSDSESPWRTPSKTVDPRLFVLISRLEGTLLELCDVLRVLRECLALYHSLDNFRTILSRYVTEKVLNRTFDENSSDKSVKTLWFEKENEPSTGGATSSNVKFAAKRAKTDWSEKSREIPPIWPWQKTSKYSRGKWARNGSARRTRWSVLNEVRASNLFSGLKRNETNLNFAYRKKRRFVLL